MDAIDFNFLKITFMTGKLGKGKNQVHQSDVTKTIYYSFTHKSKKKQIQEISLYCYFLGTSSLWTLAELVSVITTHIVECCFFFHETRGNSRSVLTLQISSMQKKMVVIFIFPLPFEIISQAIPRP